MVDMYAYMNVIYGLIFGHYLKTYWYTSMLNEKTKENIVDKLTTYLRTYIYP